MKGRPCILRANTAYGSMCACNGIYPSVAAAKKTAKNYPCFRYDIFDRETKERICGGFGD